MKALTVNRAYKVIKDIPTECSTKPGVGDVVYCDRLNLKTGKARLVYQRPCGNLFTLNANLSGSLDCFIFAKFITLPERVRRYFNIADDGTRMKFVKGSIYKLTKADDMAPEGTLMRCIKGGDKPWFCFIGDDGAAQHVEASAAGRASLIPAEPRPFDTDSIALSLDYEGFEWAGCRLRFAGTLSLGDHRLRVERRKAGDTARVAELSESAWRSINDVLFRHLRKHGHAVSETGPELIEAFINYCYYEQGLIPFAEALPRIQAMIKRDAVTRSLEASAANARRGERLQSKPTSDSYRRMLKAQYGYARG